MACWNNIMKLIQRIVGCLAAAQKNIPIVVPGWEDSTMGNIFASYVIKGELKASTMKSGIEYMAQLTEWYRELSTGKGLGFFQIGGGIAGDFPICVVPMMYQDLNGKTFLSGVISARFPIQQLLMVLIPARFPMKKLPGENLTLIRRNLLSKVMLPL